MNDKSLLLQLRDAAKLCPNILTRKMLCDSADDISARIVDVNLKASLDAFTALNNAVAKAVRTLSNADLPNGNAPNGGAMPIPYYEMAIAA
jgi:hypothetical protein